MIWYFMYKTAPGNTIILDKDGIDNEFDRLTK